MVESATVAPLFYTADDVARLFQMSVRSVYRKADSGSLPRGVKLDGLRRWPVGEIAAHAAGKRSEGCK